MTTTFSIKSVNVNELLFVGQSKSPRWNVTVVVAVVSEFGNFELGVRIEKAQTLDGAVGEAMQQVGQWGSRFGEFARNAISQRVP